MRVGRRYRKRLELRDYQERAVVAVFEDWKEHQSTLCVAATGLGKCLGRGTEVLMYSGEIKKVEDVKVGDVLMGPDSCPRHVLSTTQGEDRLYEVVPVKGKSFIVNEAHILSFKITNGAKRGVTCNGVRYESRETANVDVLSYLASNKTFRHCAKIWRAKVYFRGYQLHPDMPPYFLGLWLGDGSHSEYHISKPDQEIRFALEEFATSLGHSLVNSAGEERCPTWRVTTGRKGNGRGLRRNRATNALRDLGVIKNKHIPLAYKAASIQERKELLAGLLDSDGSKVIGGYDFISKDRQLAEDVAFLSRSIGLAAYVCSCKKSCQNGFVGKYWRVSISGDCQSLPLLIPRKKSPRRVQIKDVLVTGVKGIKPIGRGEYFGFSITGDGLFLLGDFTVTHNTQIFCEVLKRAPAGRAVVLTHRSELVFQAHERLAHFGIESDIEMADFHASTSTWNQRPVIVATVQTLAAGRNGGRKMKFNPEDFSTVICDEAHHFVAPQFREAIDHFRQNPNVKILGVSATPDRADEEALGQVFGSVAFEYGIREAIDDGWLVPIEQQMIWVEDLDYSGIRTTAGDLNGADLAEVMENEKVLQGIASSTIQIVGEKKTVVFTASVRQAERLAEIFNRHRPGMSNWICGATPKDERRMMLKNFAENKFQVLTNCAVLGEGWDEPTVEIIVQARPTKSRTVYTQQIGRATRPLPGIADAYSTPESRRKAIAESRKPACRVIDFVGNSGRHKLITTADILGDRYPDDVLALAVQKAQKDPEPKNMERLLEDAQKEIEERKVREAARKARVVGKAKFTTTAIDPFNVWQIMPQRERGWDKDRPLSEKMTAMLTKIGVNPKDCTYTQARQIVGTQIQRWKENLCSLKQAKVLMRYGYDTKTLKFDDAKKLIDKLAANNWKRV